MRTIVAAVAAVLAIQATSTQAQDPPKPGPEHEMLKRHEGTWESTMKFGEMESKGTVTYKMELGGLWLVGTMESDLGGQKFSGRSLDSFDFAKKKFVSVWADSMSTAPMIMEGSYDESTKALTLVGDAPDMEGKMARWKSVSRMPDDDTIEASMFVGDATEPMFTATYKRKK